VIGPAINRVAPLSASGGRAEDRLGPGETVTDGQFPLGELSEPNSEAVLGKLGLALSRPETGRNRLRAGGGGRDILLHMYGSPLLLLIVVLMVVGIGMRFYGMSRRRRFYGGGGGRSGQGAEQILARRFANGEISEDEYQRRLTALRQNRPSN
jgi:putative membrane protein